MSWQYTNYIRKPLLAELLVKPIPPLPYGEKTRQHECRYSLFMHCTFQGKTRHYTITLSIYKFVWMCTAISVTRDYVLRSKAQESLKHYQQLHQKHLRQLVSFLSCGNVKGPIRSIKPHNKSAWQQTWVSLFPIKHKRLKLQHDLSQHTSLRNLNTSTSTHVEPLSYCNNTCPISQKCLTWDTNNSC
jgi:hypothetical protein